VGKIFLFSRSSYHRTSIRSRAVADNGSADKTSNFEFTQKLQKSLAVICSYPLVSGSAEGTLRTNTAYRRPISEKRTKERAKPDLSVPKAFSLTVGCMRRFACRNFQITTELYSKLSYTPCYVYVKIKY
jgi:hypothetical protein